MSATGMTLDSGLLGQRDRVSRTLRRTTRIGFAMLALVLGAAFLYVAFASSGGSHALWLLWLLAPD